MFTKDCKCVGFCSVQLCEGCKERGPQKEHDPVVESGWLLSNRDEGQQVPRQLRGWKVRQPKLLPYFITISFHDKNFDFFSVIHFSAILIFLQGNFSC